jgi:hypothetical protein
MLRSTKTFGRSKQTRITKTGTKKSRRDEPTDSWEEAGFVYTDHRPTLTNTHFHSAKMLSLGAKVRHGLRPLGSIPAWAERLTRMFVLLDALSRPALMAMTTCGAKAGGSGGSLAIWVGRCNEERAWPADLDRHKQVESCPSPVHQSVGTLG